MKILTAYSYLKSQMDDRGKIVQDIPDLLNACHWSGLEIADRELSVVTEAEQSMLATVVAENTIDLVLDINVDLTYKDSSLYRSEVDYADAQLKMADRMGARLVRICLGGQTLSIQKLLKKQFRPSGSTSDGYRTSDQDSRYSISGSQRMRRLAHGIRKKTPAWVWKRDEKIERAIDSLNIIMAHAQQMSIRVGIENHWGISAKPEWILEVIQGVGSPFLGTCPDFANWPLGESPDAGVAKLAPHVFLAHLKTMDPRKNIPEQFRSIVKKVDILLDQGFSGPFTLEYDGAGDPWESVGITARMLRQHYS